MSCWGGLFSSKKIAPTCRVLLPTSSRALMH
uniref:Uncharacterized protein n=1 Tax=Populus trichocarpa TaxID=3694 RepID=A0A3N7G363_POPTR